MNSYEDEAKEVANELDRLRAALAAAESELSDVRACLANHQEVTTKLREEYASLEAENAELRRLCALAANAVDPLGWEALQAALEAASRRATKGRR